MSKHKLTITIIFEVPDGKANKASVDALDRAVEDMLDDGTLQDWILDGAGERDNFDDDCESVEASHVMEKV